MARISDSSANGILAPVPNPLRHSAINEKFASLGRRTSATLQDDTAWNYSYNQRSEITSAIRKNASNVTQNTMRYVFDNIGNRTSSYEDATSKTYDANCLNQYTEIDVTGGSSVCPLYDDDGNMTQFDSSTYTYDAENRLVGAQNGTTRLEFIYDALSRRVFKKVYLNNSLSTHERYVYDGMKLLATYNARSSFAKINTFLWQPFGHDVPLVMNYGGTVYGYLVDANKNVLGLFNPSKTRVATYLYGPFGQKLSESGTIAANNPIQFSSEQFDTDLDLIYYALRYLFPAIGKWLTKDPIGEMGGWNLYAFCGNNPVNTWDTNGKSVIAFLMPTSPLILLTIAAIGVYVVYKAFKISSSLKSTPDFNDIEKAKKAIHFKEDVNEIQGINCKETDINLWEAELELRYIFRASNCAFSAKKEWKTDFQCYEQAMDVRDYILDLPHRQSKLKYFDISIEKRFNGDSSGKYNVHHVLKVSSPKGICDDFYIDVFSGPDPSIISPFLVFQAVKARIYLNYYNFYDHKVNVYTKKVMESMYLNIEN